MLERGPDPVPDRLVGRCRRPVAEKQRRERGAIETLREEADALRQDIQQQEAELDRVARDEGDIAGALEAARLPCSVTAGARPQLEGRTDRTRAEHRQHRATADDAVARRVRAGEAAMSGRLVALYKVSSLGTAQRAGLRADSMPRGLSSAGKPLGQILAQD
ncbi:MAG: hypothetical protein MZV70_21945 [Desulfobacterales bacterium]|nr:hypothetical protein [Desulfobacterales bacterium]